jgi:hypothetical protein
VPHRVGQAGGLVALLIGVSLLHWGCDYTILGEGAVKRSPQEVTDLPPYGDELRAQELNPPEPKGPSPAYSGSGHYQRWSPDQSLLAVTTDARGYYRTVNVWNDRERRLTPVISIEDADHESGRAYRYAWSQDSKALLIYGHGVLPADEQSTARSLKLCLVYVIGRDELYSLDPCNKTQWAY